MFSATLLRSIRSTTPLLTDFADPSVRGNPAARTEWAIDQVKLAAKASRNLGLDTQVSFTGGFVWPFVYPWSFRPAGLVEDAFDELAKRWKPTSGYQNWTKPGRALPLAG